MKSVRMLHTAHFEFVCDLQGIGDVTVETLNRTK